MTVYGDRSRSLPAPPAVVWADLVERRRTGTRAWLHLERDEVMPQVLEAVEPSLVVWSSLWTDRPLDSVRLELSADGAGTRLRFTLISPDDGQGDAVGGPSAAVAGRIRYRVNLLLWADLRYSYGQ